MKPCPRLSPEPPVKKGETLLTFPKHFVFQNLSLYLATKLNVVHQIKRKRYEEVLG